MYLRKEKDRGSAEIVGVIILISILACGAALIAVLLFSQALPQKIPEVSIRFATSGNILTIYHMGGDPVPAGQYLIRINNRDIPAGMVGKSPSPSGSWVTGDVLTVAQTGISPSSYIQVVYLNGATQTVLATNSTP